MKGFVCDFIASNYFYRHILNFYESQRIESAYIDSR